MISRQGRLPYRWRHNSLGRSFDRVCVGIRNGMRVGKRLTAYDEMFINEAGEVEVRNLTKRERLYRQISEGRMGLVSGPRIYYVHTANMTDEQVATVDDSTQTIFNTFGTYRYRSDCPRSRGRTMGPPSVSTCIHEQRTVV